LFTTGTSFTRRSLGAGGHLKQMTKKMQKVAKATYAKASVTKRKGRLQTGD